MRDRSWTRLRWAWSAALLGLSVGISACCTEDVERTWEVDPQKIDRLSSDQAPVMALRISSDVGPIPMPNAKIDGLPELEWGVSYTIEFTSTRPSGIGQWFMGQGSSRFGRIVEAKPHPGEPFVLRHIGERWIDSAGSAFVDGKPFECATEEVCAALRERLKGPGDAVDLSMRFGEVVSEDPLKTGPLVLVGVSDPSCERLWDCARAGSYCSEGRCVSGSVGE